MFDLPQTKRVKRSDLRSTSSTPEPTGGAPPTTTDGIDAHAANQLRLAELLSNIIDIDIDIDTDPIAPPPPAHTTTTDSDPTNPTNAADDDDLEFSFPLFSTSTPHTKISLAPRPASPPPPPTKEQLYLEAYALAALNPTPRPHLSTPLPKAQVLACAVSGEDILRDASSLHWPGLTHPRKLIVLPLPTPQSKRKGGTGTCRRPAKNSSSNKKVGVGKSEKLELKKRCKPSKKRRILMRVKERKEREEGEAMRIERERREREELEKRKARNSAKKAKKRLREKMVKMAGAGKVGGGAGDGDVVMGGVGG
ncbi:hypothetical protein DFH27DRAFT_600315 [Peziza echinospora]|nr:hypothetical protein DFH27DRAFT_600315 [Peziza echinospora]